MPDTVPVRELVGVFVKVSLINKVVDLLGVWLIVALVTPVGVNVASLLRLGVFDMDFVKLRDILFVVLALVV